MRNKIDLNIVREFFYLSPGLNSAIIPISIMAVKKVVDELNGKKMSLAEAINKIKAVTTDKVGIESGYIGLGIKDGGLKYWFRVICWE